MTVLAVTTSGVAEHYRRHCRLGPVLDRVLARFRAAHHDDGDPGRGTSEEALAWVAAMPAADRSWLSVDLDELTEHVRERGKLLALLDQAAAAYARTYGPSGVEFASGGVTADQVHLFSRPDGQFTLTMPVSYAIAYHAALLD